MLGKKVWYKWLEEIALYPKARIVQSEERKLLNKTSYAYIGLTCCPKCKGALEAQEPYMPLWAINNNNYIGVPPECLCKLMEVELSLISPVFKHGYYIHYAGGGGHAL